MRYTLFVEIDSRELPNMLLRTPLKFIFTATVSLALGLGCADSLSDFEQSAQNPVDEENADWVRVNLDLATEHPYQDNQEENWELEAPEQARGIRVHFNAFETEENHDLFVLGEHVYHGALGNFTTKVAPGNLVPVQFSTDDSVINYGYDIDYYEYLMPHTVLGPQGAVPEHRAFNQAAKNLKLSLGHQANGILTPHTTHAQIPFEDSHYEELIEHELVYHCWRTIRPGISFPEALTLNIVPTALFTLSAIQAAEQPKLHFPKEQATSIKRLTSLSLNLGTGFRNVDIGVKIVSSAIPAAPIQGTQQTLGQSMKKIKIGFGVWKQENFNQPATHVAARPSIQKKKISIFRTNKNGSNSMRFKWTNKQGVNTFKIKSLKI